MLNVTLEDGIILRNRCIEKFLFNDTLPSKSLILMLHQVHRQNLFPILYYSPYYSRLIVINFLEFGKNIFLY